MTRSCFGPCEAKLLPVFLPAAAAVAVHGAKIRKENTSDDFSCKIVSAFFPFPLWVLACHLTFAFLFFLLWCFFSLVQTHARGEGWRQIESPQEDLHQRTEPSHLHCDYNNQGARVGWAESVCVCVCSSIRLTFPAALNLCQLSLASITVTFT